MKETLNDELVNILLVTSFIPYNNPEGLTLFFLFYEQDTITIFNFYLLCAKHWVKPFHALYYLAQDSCSESSHSWGNRTGEFNLPKVIQLVSDHRACVPVHRNLGQFWLQSVPEPCLRKVNVTESRLGSVRSRTSAGPTRDGAARTKACGAPESGYWSHRPGQVRRKIFKKFKVHQTKVSKTWWKDLTNIRRMSIVCRAMKSELGIVGMQDE